jgi:hypothetical protein
LQLQGLNIFLINSINSKSRLNILQVYKSIDTFFSSTNVWIDRCDSLKTYTPVTPNGSNWCIALLTTVNLNSSTILSRVSK